MDFVRQLKHYGHISGHMSGGLTPGRKVDGGDQE